MVVKDIKEHANIVTLFKILWFAWSAPVEMS